MSLKFKIITCTSMLILAFALGRYSVNQPAVVSTVDHRIITNVQQNRDTHKKTVVVKAPSGVETTTITEDTTTDTREKQYNALSSTISVTSPKRSTLNLSALAGARTLSRFEPVYGVSISKEVVGPVTAGLWGLSDGTIGVSVGIDF